MTSKEGYSLSEDELDEIAKRVAEQLAADGDGEDEQTDGIEVHLDDEGFGDKLGEGFDKFGEDFDERHGTVEEGSSDGEDRASDSDEDHRKQAERRKREAKRRARETRDAASGLEDLGDRIEAAVESQLEHLERSFEAGLGKPPAPPAPGVVIGPDDTKEKAVYKTQLQKGGRVAVPDTEIEALGLEPGDTLQVVLYPVE